MKVYSFQYLTCLFICFSLALLQGNYIVMIMSVFDSKLQSTCEKHFPVGKVVILSWCVTVDPALICKRIWSPTSILHDNNLLKPVAK